MRAHGASIFFACELPDPFAVTGIDFAGPVRDKILKEVCHCRGIHCIVPLCNYASSTRNAVRDLKKRSC